MLTLGFLFFRNERALSGTISAVASRTRLIDPLSPAPSPLDKSPSAVFNNCCDGSTTPSNCLLAARSSAVCLLISGAIALAAVSDLDAIISSVIGSIAGPVIFLVKKSSAFLASLGAILLTPAANPLPTAGNPAPITPSAAASVGVNGINSPTVPTVPASKGLPSSASCSGITCLTCLAASPPVLSNSANCSSCC